MPLARIQAGFLGWRMTKTGEIAAISPVFVMPFVLLSETEGEIDAHRYLRRRTVQWDKVAVDTAAIETVCADEEVEARAVDIGQDTETGAIAGYMS